LIELVLRIAFSLLVVLGLMWGLAKLARRPLTGNRGAGVLSVLNRQQLGRTASITVVRVADRALILGVTDSQVSLLGETDLVAFEHETLATTEHRDAVPLLGRANAPGEDVALTPGMLDGSVLSPRTWRSTVDFLRERTARR
jgi:flagellar protein FliO/FliZ